MSLPAELAEKKHDNIHLARIQEARDKRAEELEDLYAGDWTYMDDELTQHERETLFQELKEAVLFHRGNEEQAEECADLRRRWFQHIAKRVADAEYLEQMQQIDSLIAG